MWLEHFEYHVKHLPNREVPEKNMNHFESERPSEMEFPHFENFNNYIYDNVNRGFDDSEREIVELPQLDNEKDSLRTDFSEMCLDTTNIFDNRHETQDAENKYYSIYEERLKQTPREESNRGEWLRERGESEYIPTDEEIKNILDQYDKKSITYENAIPDFSGVSEATVEIDNMTENRANNFRQCDEKCTEQWNREGFEGKMDWTVRNVVQWRKENGYSWHERNDMKTCDLVPTKINDYFGHLGGVSECRKRDVGNIGDDFDE